MGLALGVGLAVLLDYILTLKSFRKFLIEA